MSNPFLPPELMAQLNARGIVPPTNAPTVPSLAQARADAAAAGAAPPPVPPSTQGNAMGNLVGLPPVMRGGAAPTPSYADAQRSAQAAGVVPPPKPEAEAAPAGAPMMQSPPGDTQPGMMMPARMLPAREVRAVSPETERQMAEAGRHKYEAAMLGQASEVGANEMQAKALEHISDTLGDQSDAMRMAEEARRREYEPEMAEYKRMQREAASGKIERPNVGFMATLGAALGAFGATVGHAPNFAQEAINKQIDDSLATQRANLENKHRAVAEKGNELAEMRARFGDDRRADDAYRARKLEEAKATGDAMTARAQSPMISAKWEGIKAGIEQEQAELHAKMFPWMQAQMVGGMAPKQLENVFMAPDGQRYQARDPESRKKLAGAAITYQNVKSQIADYSAALSRLGTLDKLTGKLGVNTDAMSRAQTAYNHLMSGIRQAQDDGVWKKSETEMLANTLTPPDHFTGDAKGQMTVALKQARDAWENTMRTEDALPVQQGFALTPQGQIAPRAAYTGETVAPQRAPASAFIKPVGQ